MLIISSAFQMKLSSLKKRKFFEKLKFFLLCSQDLMFIKERNNNVALMFYISYTPLPYLTCLIILALANAKCLRPFVFANLATIKVML